jgi:hypothetical protein
VQEGDQAMNIATLRLVWLVVTERMTASLLVLSDTEITQHFLKLLNKDLGFSPEEQQKVEAYLGARVSLIRDLAV